MNALLDVTEAPILLSKTELLEWGPHARVLNAALTYAELPDEFKAVLVAKGANGRYPASIRQQFYTQLMQKKHLPASYGNVLSTTWSAGGSVEMMPRQDVSFITKNKDQEEILVNPVNVFPLVEGVIQREGLDNVVSFVTSYFKVKDRKVDLAHEASQMGTLFTKSQTTFEPISPLSSVKEIIDPFLKNMKEVSTSALTGERWCQFVAERLSECSWTQYFSLHTVICMKLFKAKDTVPKLLQGIIEKLEVKGNTDRDRAVKAFYADLKSRGSGVTGWIWKGQLPVQYHPTLNLTFKPAILAAGLECVSLQVSQVATALLGGKTGGAACITAGCGVFNMAGRAETNLIKLVSLVLATFERFKKVAVLSHAPSEGQIVLDSLQAMAGPISPHQFKWVLTPQELSHSSLDPQWAALRVPDGFPVVIFRPDDKVKVLSKMSEIIEAHGRYLDSYLEGMKDYVFYGPVFGREFEGRFVFRFGNCSDFTGGIATWEISLPEKDKGEWSFKSPAFVKTKKAWYDLVVGCVRWRLSYSMCPKPYYAKCPEIVTIGKTTQFTLMGDKEAFESASNLFGNTPTIPASIQQEVQSASVVPSSVEPKTIEKPLLLYKYKHGKLMAYFDRTGQSRKMVPGVKVVWWDLCFPSPEDVWSGVSDIRDKYDDDLHFFETVDSCLEDRKAEKVKTKEGIQKKNQQQGEKSVTFSVTSTAAPPLVSTTTTTTTTITTTTTTIAAISVTAPVTSSQVIIPDVPVVVAKVVVDAPAPEEPAPASAPPIEKSEAPASVPPPDEKKEEPKSLAALDLEGVVDFDPTH